MKGASNLLDRSKPTSLWGSWRLGEKLIRFDESLISSRLVEELQRVLSSLKKLALGRKKLRMTFFRYCSKQVGCEELPSGEINLLVKASPSGCSSSPKMKLLKKCCSSSVNSTASDWTSKSDESSSSNDWASIRLSYYRRIFFVGMQRVGVG